MCIHARFHGNVSVFHVTEQNKDPVNETDIKGYMAQVKVTCADCGQVFEFIGVETGYSYEVPRSDFEGTTLRAPIRPGKEVGKASKN